MSDPATATRTQGTRFTEKWWVPKPHIFSAPVDLPTEVRIYEVGPRDGLQAEATPIPTDIKVEFCKRLVDAGVRTVETTSFVSPRWIPQLADADELMAKLVLPEHVRQVVLTPNMRGLERARSSGCREVAVFVSATETFAQKNLNTDIKGALATARTVAGEARSLGMRVRGYISMCFGDPWEGCVEASAVATVASELMAMGCSSISLGDTIGVATPGHVYAIIDAVRSVGIASSAIAGHFHDTYGQGLSNVYAALTLGVTEFDSSAGGLGRCPYALGATGNLATEDLVWMLQGLGIETGVNLDRLASTSLWMAEHVGRVSPSRVVAALSAADGRTGRP